MITINGIVTRHAKKVRQVPERETGTLVDKSIPLSDAGRAQMQDLGRRLITTGFYDIIDATTSPFTRTRESVHEAVQAAGYDPHSVSRTEREDIGLAACNWLAPGVPSYERAPSESHYVQELLQRFFVGPPGSERKPVLAKFAYGLLDSILNGIDRIHENSLKDSKGLVIVATHGPIIDALDAMLYGTISPRDGQISLDHFSGNYAVGDTITFEEVAGTPSGDLTFNFKGKGGEKRISYDHLSTLRDRAGMLGEGRIPELPPYL